MTKIPVADTPPKTQWHHRHFPFLPQPDKYLQPGTKSNLEVIALDVEPGVEPSKQPPVRIFLGTQSAHFRAERVFVWSVKKNRNPSRVYKIFLMKDLKGFDHSGWKTGFSHYRYAVPELAGCHGRAIYNDVNQIYLADPAELFDREMHGAGVLSLTPRRNSVMLIDCEKMSQLWSLDDIKSSGDHDGCTEQLKAFDLWAKLNQEWNVRDYERLGEQHNCLSYERLHTQPWQPFRKQFKYSHSPAAVIWHRLEREANNAGFMLFDKDNPSKHFQTLIEQYQLMHEDVSVEELFNGSRLPRSLKPVTKLIAECGAKTVLDYGSGKGEFYVVATGEPSDSRIRLHPQWPGVKVVCYDPGYTPFSEPFEGKVDGVVSTDVVEHIPEEDVPWVLDEMFRHAKCFVYVLAANYQARAVLPNGDNAHCTIQPGNWWAAQMALVAQRYPGITWMLGCDSYSSVSNKKKRTYHTGIG